MDDLNTISRICKGQIDGFRKAWKQIYLAEQKERGKGRDDRTTPLLEYRKHLESYHRLNTCLQLLLFFEKHLQ